MATITLNSVTFNPTPVTNQTVTVEYKKSWEDPSAYVVWTNSANVLTDGTFSPPVVITGLSEDSDWTVRVTGDCGTEEIEFIFVAHACEDCNLVLEDIVQNQLSIISAGVLSSTNCTVGEYVIDWRLGSTLAPVSFTSGSSLAAHSDVTVVHPFPGEPAQGGTWYPTIRFVVLDGVTYSSQGSIFSGDLLACLTPIEVDSWTCSNGGAYGATSTPGPTDYQHKLVYNNVLNSPTLASRSLRFDLDNTVKYLAWYFAGYNVSDRMTITYISPTNGISAELEDFRIGGDLAANNIASDPKDVDWTYMYKIIGFTQYTYTAGDYLRIDITPSAANSNTNWEFLCRCLTTIDCSTWDSTLREIIPGTLNFAWDAPSCAYLLNYQKPVFTSAQVNASILHKYHYSQSSVTGTGLSGSSIYNVANVYLPMYDRISSSTTSVNNGNACIATDASYTVTKSGNTVTLVFSDVDDYNAHKTAYTNITGHASFLTYDPDPTVRNHYKAFLVNIKIAASCGDTLTSHLIYLHFSNPPVFNDGTNTITITKGATMTNQYVANNACDTVITQTGIMVNNINNVFWTTVGDFSTSSSVRNVPPIFGQHVTEVVTLDTNKTFKHEFRFTNATICNLSPKGWTHQRMNLYDWNFPIVLDRVIITDTDDSANNFEFYRRTLKSAGLEVATFPEEFLVYKKVNGVVTEDNITLYNMT